MFGAAGTAFYKCRKRKDRKIDNTLFKNRIFTDDSQLGLT